jgi:hypothetical protein
LWPASKCYHKTCVCMLDLLGATAKETQGISERQNMHAKGALQHLLRNPSIQLSRQK